MHQFGRVDNALAWCSCDVHFIVLDPLAIHPEGEGAEAPFLGKIFRHPGSVRAERFGEILYQRSKKSVSRFGSGSLENCAEGGVRFKTLKRCGVIHCGRGNGKKLWDGTRGRFKGGDIKAEKASSRGLIFNNPPLSRSNGSLHPGLLGTPVS